MGLVPIHDRYPAGRETSPEVEATEFGNTNNVESTRDAIETTNDAVRNAVEDTNDLADLEVASYAHGHDRPLRQYAALITAYLGAVGVGVVVGRRRGVRLPDRVGAGDIALIAVATHRLSRLISKDSITSVVRAPFTRYIEPAGAGEVNEEVRGSGFRHAAGELIGCPFCLDQWVATAFVGGLVMAPRPTRAIASVFATVALADVLQFAYAALQERE
jgi:Protein of unknown function (DUF1360)